MDIGIECKMLSIRVNVSSIGAIFCRPHNMRMIQIVKKSPTLHTCSDDIDIPWPPIPETKFCVLTCRKSMYNVRECIET